jgi:hypothetical protein
VSAPTYFENVNGFRQQQAAGKEATLSLDRSLLTSSVLPARPSAATLTRFSFLSGGRSDPSLNFARGFKTKRSDAGTLPFTRYNKSRNAITVIVLMLYMF